MAFATFEDRVGAPDQRLQFEGPWAWFRMIDNAMAPQPEADGLSVLSLQTPYHRAVLTIEAPSGKGNAFVARGLAAVWMRSLIARAGLARIENRAARGDRWT